MFELFKEFGLVAKVVIPPKRDKRGKVYRFVRFMNVTDERILVVKLDNIFIKAKKIHANVPRFQCGREVDNHSRLHLYVDGANEQGGKEPKAYLQRRNGIIIHQPVMKNNIKSFSQVVREEVRNEKELRVGGTMNPHSGVKEDKWKKMWG